MKFSTKNKKYIFQIKSRKKGEEKYNEDYLYQIIMALTIMMQHREIGKKALKGII